MNSEINESTNKTAEELVKEFYELHAEEKRLADLQKSLKDKIIKEMGDKTEWEIGDFKVMNTPATRKTADIDKIEQTFNITIKGNDELYKVTKSSRFSVDRFVTEG